MRRTRQRGRGPRLEWWVECWDGEPPGWVFHSIHADKAEALDLVEKRQLRFGGAWRVLEVAAYQLQVFGEVRPAV